MKQLQNNFTTPKQSKRLLELGVPANSADLYVNLGFENLIWIRNTKNELREDFFDALINGKCANIPIWSVGRLVEMWEKCVGVKFDRLSRNGVLLPLIQDCIEHIEFALNPYTELEFDFSKLEE